MLAVNYFVAKVNNVFTIDFLNSKLLTIRFLNKNSHEKILVLKKDSNKLPGSASENLRLLQIFPFAVYDAIDASDPVWKMIVLLREICL